MATNSKRNLGYVMIVYRLENDEGLGPFRSNTVLNCFSSRYAGEIDSRHPTPFVLQWDIKYEKHLFAFRYKYNILEWFKFSELKEIDKKSDRKFWIVKLFVNRTTALSDNNQVMYDKQDAITLGKISLERYLQESKITGF